MLFVLLGGLDLFRRQVLLYFVLLPGLNIQINQHRPSWKWQRHSCLYCNFQILQFLWGSGIPPLFQQQQIKHSIAASELILQLVLLLLFQSFMQFLKNILLPLFQNMSVLLHRLNVKLYENLTPQFLFSDEIKRRE